MFFCGVVSPCKNLPTNALGTNLIMEKEGKCQFITAPTSTITSRFHHRLRMIVSPLALVLFSSWIRCTNLLAALKVSSLFVLLRTQLPQAVGAAYSLKMDGKDACVVTYFGDGGSSEVITHLCTIYS